MSDTEHLAAAPRAAPFHANQAAAKRTGWWASSSVALCTLASCAQPVGPTVQVLPPAGKPFAVFEADERECSLNAGAQVKPMMDRAAYAQLGTAAIGTVLGAGLGAAIGGGNGAGIGAAAGAIGGTGVAADQGASSDARIQAFYNNTYAACMASHGNAVQAPQTVVVAAPPVIIQPAPYVVQPAPYVAAPAYVAPAQ